MVDCNYQRTLLHSVEETVNDISLYSFIHWAMSEGKLMSGPRLVENTDISYDPCHSRRMVGRNCQRTLLRSIEGAVSDIPLYSIIRWAIGGRKIHIASHRLSVALSPICPSSKLSVSPSCSPTRFVPGLSWMSSLGFRDSPSIRRSWRYQELIHSRYKLESLRHRVQPGSLVPRTIIERVIILPYPHPPEHRFACARLVKCAEERIFQW